VDEKCFNRNMMFFNTQQHLKRGVNTGETGKDASPPDSRAGGMPMRDVPARFQAQTHKCQTRMNKMDSAVNLMMNVRGPCEINANRI
jgi:hypothetical protein